MRKFLLLMLICIPLVYAVPASFSDQGTDLTLNGEEVASGGLGITIWDAASGGNLIYAENFSLAIVNGSWNVILNDSLLNSLEFGRKYWKDYTINGTDLDFSGDERIALYASVGLITNQSLVNASAVGGWSTNGSVATTTQNVGIGTASPNASLDVNGTINTVNGYAMNGTIILHNTGTQNTFVGEGAGANITSGIRNVAVGWFAGNALNTGSQNIFMGRAAGDKVTTANDNILIGYKVTNALTTGSRNIIFGRSAGNTLVNGSDNIIIGGDVSNESATYELNIGDAIYGNLTSGDIGIGTTRPTAGLHINKSGDDGSFLVQNTTESVHLFINGSSGKVGVGTTSPGSLLHVNSAGSATPHADSEIAISRTQAAATAAQLEIISGNAGDSIIYFSDTDAAGRGRIQYDHVNDSLDFFTGSSEKVTIDSSGNVGIGTASPNSKLDIDGNITINLTATNRLILPLNNNATVPTISFGDGDTGFFESGDDTLQISLGGTIYGEFTTSGFSRGQSGGPQMGWSTPTLTSPSLRPSRSDANTGIGGNLSDTLALITGGVTALVADANQNVGIGTTAPGEKLHVNGSINVTTGEDICITGGNCLSTVTGGNVTGMTQWRLDTDTGDIFTVTNNTLINITSGASITSTHSSGNITIDVADNSIDGTELADSITLDANLAFDGGGDVTFNNTVLHIDNTNSRVGAGTASPARALHINDVMRIEPRSSAPSSGSLGDVYIDSDTNELCFYNSTDWTGMQGRACA